MIFVFAIAFVVVWGILIYYLFQSIAIWRRNNRSPKIIELATVVAKRKGLCITKILMGVMRQQASCII